MTIADLLYAILGVVALVFLVLLGGICGGIGLASILINFCD